jgi:nitrite reductase (NADH) small subunit
MELIAHHITSRTFCYNLGPLDNIPQGEGRTYQVSEYTVAVFHTRQGNVYATQATCTHKNGPLADGLVGSGKVICPLHAYKFDLATGEAIGHTCQSLKTYPVSITVSGDILLSFSE